MHKNAQSRVGWGGKVYVVDSADCERMEEASSELGELLGKEDKLAGVPVLVFANKQDLLNAETADVVWEKCRLSDISDREIHIQACSAKTGDGLQEGMEWLVTKMNDEQGAGGSAGK